MFTLPIDNYGHIEYNRIKIREGTTETVYLLLRAGAVGRNLKLTNMKLPQPGEAESAQDLQAIYL